MFIILTCPQLRWLFMLITYAFVLSADVNGLHYKLDEVVLHALLPCVYL